MNIFDAAEGFRPKACIVAYPSMPITIDDPTTTTSIIRSIISVFMTLLYCSTMITHSFLKNLTMPFLIDTALSQSMTISPSLRTLRTG